MNKGQQLVAAEIVLSSGATEFTKVHEVGHVEQGLKDPETVLPNSEAADDAQTYEEYNNNPTEVYADEFAREVLDGRRPPR